MVKLILVSNRLPVSVRRFDDSLQLVPSSGGLSRALQTVVAARPTVWVGWPGQLTPAEADHPEFQHQLNSRGLVPVTLDREEVRGFYNGYCNEVLWPLFHYLGDRIPLRNTHWEFYRRVNQRFAEAVLEQYRDGDTIWVHDYHLLLLPGMIRRELPHARIGFFLHTPFPSFEVFRVLPQRAELVKAMLGADLVGFHTASYLREFSRAVVHLLGAEVDGERVLDEGRSVELGVFPVGVDTARFDRLARTPSVQAEVKKLRAGNECRIAVAVDRLDYTKGIPRRLLAFETLLEQYPEWRGRVQLVQVAIPSRGRVREYRRLRSRVDRLVGRINGRFGTPHWNPVIYLYRTVSDEILVGLYRAADIMLVTPVRDGLNLVCKEFIACREDEDGVLVLSEFAGAAAELAEAIQVNPYDIGGTASAYHQALTRDREERATRMRALRERTTLSALDTWTVKFLTRLVQARRANRGSLQPSVPAVVASAVTRLAGAPSLELLLDYDGTLVPFAPTPDLARPDEQVRSLLRALAARPGTTVHVVTGRCRSTIEAWLGDLPIHIHAEHGYWSRVPGEPWEHHPAPRPSWHEPAYRILREFTRNTPGSLIEEKTAGLAWHYRMVDPAFGQRPANELRVHLSDLFSNLPVQILSGQKVVELRSHGIDKGIVADRVLRRMRPDTLVAAFGDDATDEDLFRALPDPALTFHVGARPSLASHRLPDVAAVRGLLRRLLVGGESSPAASTVGNRGYAGSSA
jgi:trehalose 6-phosphate synthase/phosphatase